MQTIVIAGGNSGIGRHAAVRLAASGHRLILLGRDSSKGAQIVDTLGARAARFLKVDLSTHDGVRLAATQVLSENDAIDAVLHSTGLLMTKEARTNDGLHPFFAVNYLSRYHLTQLLLPALRRVERARVVMMTASVPPADCGLGDFPWYEHFNFFRMRQPIQLANHHYAAHLAMTEPTILAGVVNAGAADTDILRSLPRGVRSIGRALGPLAFDSLDTATVNPAEATRRDDWIPATYWPKPGKFNVRSPIALDPATTQHVVDVSRALTAA